MIREFKDTVSVEKALKLLLESIFIGRLEAEAVGLEHALERVLAKDVIAGIDVPPCDRSAVDGYAVVAEDTFGASQTNPAVLKVTGKVGMGVLLKRRASRGEAVSVTTGSAIPPGADGVVMIEYTRVVEGGRLEVYRPVAPGENISMSGEDVRKGQKVLSEGTVLKPQHLGVLANLGVLRVEVVRRPVVAVLSTGDELVEPGGGFKAGRTVDVNRIILTSMARETGAEPLDLGIARDKLSMIVAKIRRGLTHADIVVVSGGTSVSSIDLVPEAVNRLGKPGMIVHGVSIRPGTPTGLASISGKPIALLSGYPVAAMLGFNLFVRPLILRLLGTHDQPRPSVKAIVARKIPHSTGLRSFVRVVVKKSGEHYVAEPLKAKGSGVLTSMTKANGILVIPEHVEGYDAGAMVDVTLIGSVVEDA